MPDMFKDKFRAWAFLIVVVGCLFGGFIIGPLLNLQIPPESNYTSLLHDTANLLHIRAETLGGAIIGATLSLILIPLIFYGNPDVKKRFEILERGGWNEFIHPTMLPITIAVVWMALCVVIVFVRDMISNKPFGDFLRGVFVVPIAFLFGLSGFLMLKRNEVVGRYGEIHKGFWAYLNGILLILLGWGGLVYLLLAWMFK